MACNTVLSDMRGFTASNYSTVYARKSFTVPVGGIPDTLSLKVRYDDGCIVWINGTEVFRANMAPGENAYTAVATNFVGTAGWTTVDLTDTSSYLFGGTNVIAIQAVNGSKGSSPDFNIDAELGTTGSGFLSGPTPGAANQARLDQNLTPPQVRQVSHSPKEPAAGQDVTITARSRRLE